MRLTIDQVRRWKPAHLHSRSDYARTLDDATFGGRRILSDGRDTLMESWQGVAADAAGDHADHEMRAAGVVAGAFEDLATALRDAGTAIEGALEIVLREIDTATGRGFTVTDAGVTAAAEVDDPAAAQAEGTLHAEAINAALDVLAAIDGEQAAAISEAVSRLRDAVDGPAGVGRADGELLAEITSDGFITHDDLQRLRAGFDAAGITPAFMERLLRGEEVHDLPPGAVEFLHAYFEDVGVAGFLEVQEALDARGGDDARVVSAQLGDGLLALSHERIGDVTGGRGGFSALPQSIRALPTADIVHGFPASSPYRGVGVSGYSLDRQALSDTFWGEVGKGTAPPGAELGARLFVGASNHVLFFEREQGGEGTEHIFNTDFAGEGLRAENSGQSMLEISSRNHESVTRVLTGDLDGDPSTPPVQRDEILNPLFRREWGDGGAALGRNLSWMTESLAAEPHSEEWRRAGTASFALAQYLSHEENFDAFMDVRGENSVNIGELSPELVRSMEQGLRGAVDYMIKAPMNDLPGWSVSDSSEPLPLETDHSTASRFDHAKRVATLLSTDPVSDIRFGAEISRLVDERLNDPGRASTTEAGRLVALNEHAEFMVQKEMTDDGGLSAAEAYERRRDGYEVIVDGVSGLGTGPWSGLVDIGVQHGGDAARESIIGTETTYDPDKNVAASSDEENSLKALHSAVTSALSSGRLTPEDLATYTKITDGNGNLLGSEITIESSDSSDLAQELQQVLDSAGVEFGYDQQGYFVNGYSAMRPLRILE